MAMGNGIDLQDLSMKKRKSEKKRVNKRKINIIMGGQSNDQKRRAETGAGMG
jgi:hypothetical protein